jgi:RNA polymerase-binding transcription factor DksA
MGGDTKGDEEKKDQPEKQGSSSEPEWGRHTTIDHEKELKQWQETNIGQANKETYRFGHCHLCHVPIATRRSTPTFTCFECRKEEQTDINTKVSSTKDKGKNERDGF